METLEITEAGNGWPSDGELVGMWECGEPLVFRVRSIGRIDTYASGRPSTCQYGADRISVDEVIDDIDMDRDDLGLRPLGIEIIAIA